MSELLNRISKTIEDGLGLAKKNALNLVDIAEDYGRTAKIKFDIFQLESAKKRKMELLGETVFPYLIQNNLEALKKHETLAYLLDSVKDINNKIQLENKSLQALTDLDYDDSKKKQREELRSQIDEVEREIEERIKALKIVKESLV
jgi:vacuolar-type H+-ATPase subunit I/STV1